MKVFPYVLLDKLKVFLRTFPRKFGQSNENPTLNIQKVNVYTIPKRKKSSSKCFLDTSNGFLTTRRKSIEVRPKDFAQ